MPYFNGRTTLQEMQYRTRLDKRDLRHIITLFKEHVGAKG
jgi:hypothetical protein